MWSSRTAVWRAWCVAAAGHGGSSVQRRRDAQVAYEKFHSLFAAGTCLGCFQLQLVG